jgi:hypothetical protein
MAPRELAVRRAEYFGNRMNYFHRFLRTVPPQGHGWDERCLRGSSGIYLTPSFFRFDTRDNEKRHRRTSRMRRKGHPRL